MPLRSVVGPPFLTQTPHQISSQYFCPLSQALGCGQIRSSTRLRLLDKALDLANYGLLFLGQPVVRNCAEAGLGPPQTLVNAGVVFTLLSRCEHIPKPRCRRRACIRRARCPPWRLGRRRCRHGGLGGLVLLIRFFGLRRCRLRSGGLRRRRGHSRSGHWHRGRRRRRLLLLLGGRPGRLRDCRRRYPNLPFMAGWLEGGQQNGKSQGTKKTRHAVRKTVQERALAEVNTSPW